MAQNIWDKFDKEIDIKGLAEDIKEAVENGDNYKDVPHGQYEVEVSKLELIESKNGKPMVTIWFKILEGEYKGSNIFMNQVVQQGFQFSIVNKILRSLVQEIDGFEIEFKSHNQYGNLLMDVLEAINGNFEYNLDYGKGKKDFSTYTIEEVYVLE